MAASPPLVHALVDDLFFRAKIEATATAVGVRVAFARTAQELTAWFDGDDLPTLVLVDLALADHEAARAIRTLKDRPGPPAVVAFGPHQDVDAFAAARAAGADRVLARSALVARLPGLLQGDAS